MYSNKFMEHFLRPKNNGKLEDFDFYGKAVHSVDSDEIVIYIKLEGKIIKKVGYQIKGCPRAIAASSAFSTLIKGKSMEEALNISEHDIRKELEFYDEKFTCISIPVEAFKKAVEASKNE